MMKKKVLILALALLIAFAFSSCTPSASIKYTQSPDADMEIYYVDAGEICSKKLTVPADYTVVIGEWLKANDLDGRFQIVGTRIYNEQFERVELSEYKFVYKDVYEFYFDADITDYLEKEENKLCSQSLKMTLDAAEEVMSRLVDEYIANNFS